MGRTTEPGAESWSAIGGQPVVDGAGEAGPVLVTEDLDETAVENCVRETEAVEGGGRRWLESVSRRFAPVGRRVGAFGGIGDGFRAVDAAVSTVSRQ